MGIWIEVGIFVVALAFGIWQLRDVGRARAELRARKEKDTGNPPPT